LKSLHDLEWVLGNNTGLRADLVLAESGAQIERWQHHKVVVDVQNVDSSEAGFQNYADY